MNVLDLFSGIGAFSLGLERAGMRTVAFCEIDPFCRRVLAKHWGVVGYGAAHDASAADFSALRGRVDVITAGFPCQDISRLGKRGGHNGHRSKLWREAIRAVSEIRPRYIIMENSPALLDTGLGDILGSLAALGYDAVWHCIPAAYIGARHHRDRLWIVGYLPDAKSTRFEQCWRLECEKGSVEERRLRYGFAEPLPPRTSDGTSNRTHRNRAIGNAVIPQIPEIIGRAIMTAVAETRRTDGGECLPQDRGPEVWIDCEVCGGEGSIEQWESVSKWSIDPPCALVIPCQACNGAGGNISAADPTCEICGGDCSAANPPVYNCPLDSGLSTDTSSSRSPSLHREPLSEPSISSVEER